MSAGLGWRRCGGGMRARRSMTSLTSSSARRRTSICLRLRRTVWAALAARCLSGRFWLAGRRRMAAVSARGRGRWWSTWMSSTGVRIARGAGVIGSCWPAPEGAPRPAAPFSTRLRRATRRRKQGGDAGGAADADRPGCLLLPESAVDLRRELLTLRVSLTASGGERIEAPGVAADDLADALGLAAYPYQRDGRWRVYLQDLCYWSLRLPVAVEVGVLEGGPSVGVDGGGAIPRTPTWASVFGPEVTCRPGRCGWTPRRPTGSVAARRSGGCGRRTEREQSTNRPRRSR